MKKLIGIFIILLVLIGGFVYMYRSGKLGASKQVGREVVKVGAIFPLTGANASYGEEARNAIDMALESLSKTTGDGPLIEVVYEDSQFQSAPALSAYEKLREEGVHLFLTIGSQVGVSVGQKVVKDGNLNYELTAVSPNYRDGSGLTCRSALTADVSAKIVAETIIKNDYKRVATLTTQDEQGRAVVDTLKNELAKVPGFGIIEEEGYLLTNTDFRTQISKLRHANPDALVVIAPGQLADLVFRQLKDATWAAPIFSNNFTINNRDLTDLSLVEGVVFSDYSYVPKTLSTDTTSSVAFKQQYFDRHKQSPPVVAATAYDAINIFARGISLGHKNPIAMSEYISHLQDYQGIVGKLAFDSDCEAKQPAVLRKVVRGQFETVESR